MLTSINSIVDHPHMDQEVEKISNSFGTDFTVPKIVRSVSQDNNYGNKISSNQTTNVGSPQANLSSSHTPRTKTNYDNNPSPKASSSPLSPMSSTLSSSVPNLSPRRTQPHGHTSTSIRVHTPSPAKSKDKSERSKSGDNLPGSNISHESHNSSSVKRSSSGSNHVTGKSKELTKNSKSSKAELENHKSDDPPKSSRRNASKSKSVDTSNKIKTTKSGEIKEIIPKTSQSAKTKRKSETLKKSDIDQLLKTPTNTKTTEASSHSKSNEGISVQRIENKTSLTPKLNIGGTHSNNSSPNTNANSSPASDSTPLSPRTPLNGTNWRCMKCTVVNSLNYNRCQMCGHPKGDAQSQRSTPTERQKYWVCKCNSIYSADESCNTCGVSRPTNPKTNSTFL
eukprot:TRINITY_DN4166_c0_g1_i3.p1 TRINITY_DN4166_c0_g1~~TRINITY_DN4166_c0_g1_i3.p1  ORF type:complete len:395 (-),score=66.20 TRINITY_DN4166_c0_g1_i3:311-1495(-)